MGATDTAATTGTRERVFTVEATPLKYGSGASTEAGWELRRLGVTHALVVCDPHVRAAGLADGITAQFDAHGIVDTARVANLLATHGGEVVDYVNLPVGGGRTPPTPLKPHLAIPTTAGTGSEATTVAVLDLPALKVKSGISHRYLRPSQTPADRPPYQGANPVADLWSARGLEDGGKYLRRAVVDGTTSRRAAS